jgi:hypothetical protein
VAEAVVTTPFRRGQRPHRAGNAFTETTETALREVQRRADAEGFFSEAGIDGRGLQVLAKRGIVVRVAIGRSRLVGGGS